MKNIDLPCLLRWLRTNANIRNGRCERRRAGTMV